jgi:rubredoxin
MTRKFQKRKEDFVCEKCGVEVAGSGYTNHCPECLCGKHVDINPGDRASECKGMMAPVSVETKGDMYILLHRCEKCGFERKNKVGEKDNFEQVLEITSKKA